MPSEVPGQELGSVVVVDEPHHACQSRLQVGLMPAAVGWSCHWAPAWQEVLGFVEVWRSLGFVLLVEENGIGESCLCKCPVLLWLPVEHVFADNPSHYVGSRLVPQTLPQSGQSSRYVIVSIDCSWRRVLFAL